MKKIPVLLTFDDNMSLPAAICISSLLMSARPDTFYDFFVFYSGKQPGITGFEKIREAYPNFSISFRSVGNVFNSSYEIRGITKATYFRLLAPALIPEYDKVIYADTDILFRNDLGDIWDMEMGDNYLAALYAPSLNLEKEGLAHLCEIGVEPGYYFMAGFLLMNLKKIREDGLVDVFVGQASDNNYKFQDQDIVNIVCKGRILPLPRSVAMGVADFMYMELYPDRLPDHFVNSGADEARNHSNIHYNGVKPWKGLCPNFDIWWEYYRKSPVYDPLFYFKFYYNNLEPLDKLSLSKRLKILARYFIHGRKKDI